MSSNNDTLIGRKIKHHRFGDGVISNIRYKGAEYYVKFKDTLETWVRLTEVELNPDNFKPKANGSSVEDIKPEFIPLTETIAVPLSREPIKLEPQSSNEFKARRMVEAFRLGIVPFFDVENFTFGRNAEIKKINDFLAKFDTTKGESIFLEAEYGSGKTHFLDYLYYVALKKGYLVAKSRINAEDVPPYKPKQVYRELVSSMRYLDNGSEKKFRDLLNKVSSPNIFIDVLKEHRFFNPAMEIIKNENDVEEFYRWIEGDSISRYYMNHVNFNLKSLPLLKDFGTVADNYCYILSGIGNMVKLIGLKGFVILIDEGEKFFDPLGGSYKQNALNFLWGLIYTSINESSLLDEDSYRKLGLFHSSTASRTPFIYKSPSNIFLVIAFTDISEQLKSDYKENIIRLSKFKDVDFKQLFEELVDIYQKAYSFKLNTEQKSDVLKSIMNKNDFNLRWFVKSTIEALDLIRHFADETLDEVLEYE